MTNWSGWTRPNSGGGRRGSPSNRNRGSNGTYYPSGTRQQRVDEASARYQSYARSYPEKQRQVAAQSEADRRRLAELNREAAGTLNNYEDTWEGATIFDMLGGMPTDTSGGGDGSRGGGGSRGASAADRAAYAQMLAALDAGNASSLAALNARGRATLGALDTRLATGSRSFDERRAALARLNDEAAARVGSIYNDLNSGLGNVRSQVGAAYGAADTGLADLGSRFAAADAQREAGLSRGLGAFGVDGLDTAVGDPLMDLLAASRVNMRAMGGLSDANLADRSSVYGALRGDADLARGQQYDVLGSRLALERTQFEQDLAAQRAAQEAELAFARSKAEQEAAMARAQLLMQASQAGVSL